MHTSSYDNNRLDINYYNNTKQTIIFHSHIQYEIYFFHGGECTYLIGDKIYSLSPGDIIIMDGLTLHRPILSDEKDYIRSTLHFDATYFKEILDGMEMGFLLDPFTSLTTNLLHLNESEQREANALLEKMNGYKDKHDAISKYRLQLTFLELLAIIYSTSKVELKNNRLSSKEDHVQQIVSYIEEHYMKDMSLEMLENELHISKFYLSKVFKNVTGFTVFNYLYQRRINQAKIEFLINKELSVTDACYLVGFKHPAHFTKVFKRLVGCTPEQYKKNI